MTPPTISCGLQRMGFPGGSDGKESACRAGDLGFIPGRGRLPGGGNGSHSSVLACEVPWTEEPGCSPSGCRESDTTKQLALTENGHWPLWWGCFSRQHTPAPGESAGLSWLLWFRVAEWVFQVHRMCPCRCPLSLPVPLWHLPWTGPCSVPLPLLAAPWQCVWGLVGPSLLVSVHNKVNRLKQPPPVTSLFHQKPRWAAWG